MKKVIVKIEGMSPLLYNRFRDSQIEGKSKKRTGSPHEQDIEDKLYLVDGIPYIPSVYFRNALVEAGKQFKIIGKGKANYSKLIGATVDIMPEAIINKHDWKPFRIAAVNPMTKGRMMVTRPRMDKWGCEFEIILNDDSIEAYTIKEILEHAGKYVGIGDWRPAKKGMFGKFTITSFKEEV